MPTDPLQLALAAFELCLLLAGTWLVFRIGFLPGQQARWLGTNHLPVWAVTLPEFFVYVLLMLTTGALIQLGTTALLNPAISQATDRAGLAVMVYGSAFHGGSLLGCLLFPLLRKKLYFNYGSQPPEITPPPPPLSWSQCFVYGAGALLVLLPVLSVLSLGWNFLLRHLGLPDEPQDLLAIFSQTRSPLVIAGMLVVACVIAPLNEELLFRAGLYRYCRQHLGRRWALIISGCLFGAMHANLAGFLPLAVLGAILALTYEATGSVRVVVITHALFNLNTIAVIFSGLPTT